MPDVSGTEVDGRTAQDERCVDDRIRQDAYHDPKKYRRKKFRTRRGMGVRGRSHRVLIAFPASMKRSRVAHDIQVSSTKASPGHRPYEEYPNFITVGECANNAQNGVDMGMHSHPDMITECGSK